MKIGNQVTNPGELDKKITLYKRSITTSAGGFQKPILGAKIDDVWAKCVGVHGSEAWTANTLNVMRAMTILIRYRADLDETCIADLDGEYFEFVSMDDIRKKHEYIELKVKLWRPG